MQPQEVCMFSASELAQLHFELLVKNNARWQSLLGQEIVWELVYAASLGHPTRLSGHAEVFRHAAWFAGAVDNFRFFDLRLYPLADADSLFAEVKAEGTIKATGLLYQQDYLVLMRARAGKIVFLREYFDPVRAARALGVSL
jgi:ketosteroid isomerase-like protein